MTTRIATALLLGALSLYVSPGLAAAEEADSLEELVIETAKTPAEHAALASHYRAKAEEARADVRRHEKMLRAYGLGPIKGTQVMKMQGHCKKLSELSGSLATEYEGLAKEHEAAAKKTP